MGVAKTHEHGLIGYADGVAGNSISRRANTLSLTAGVCSSNTEGGFGTPLDEMTPTKLTNAPEGFEYYRVCDQEGVCHVVRGMQEVQRLLEKRPGLNVTKIP